MDSITAFSAWASPVMMSHRIVSRGESLNDWPLNLLKHHLI